MKYFILDDSRSACPSDSLNKGRITFMIGNSEMIDVTMLAAGTTKLEQVL